MIIRLLYAVVYSALVIILTGIPQAALAVVSCQDTINPNSSIRYSDALVSFKAYNGRTYAVAKSAATGGATAAETFFDFTANITRAYEMTGDATGSLKNLLSLGQFGAAMPVTIDSAETRQFILTQYGKYLGDAATPQSTYIDAWKEFGSSGFTTINGAALSFTDWASSVYTGQDPQAVVIGADGKWTSGLDGVRNAQIVQFDGTLDCAVSFSPPGSGTPPPPTPPPTDSTGPDLSKPVCGQDLNGNGYAGDPGEVVNCLPSPQGLFCPVGAVNCVGSYSAPVCPAGSTLNTSRDMCQAAATVTCGSGYTYDASIDKCVEQVTCPDGGVFNAQTDRCEKLATPACPAGYTYDSAKKLCTLAVNCGAGATFDSARDRCEEPPAWNCPNGFIYNSVAMQCESAPYCPVGTTYNTTRNRCEAAIGSCPAGYSYNAVLGRCVASATCSGGGTLNASDGKCELAVSINCPSGWTYDSATGKCEQAPSCAPPGSYNITYDLCLTSSTGTVCPSGYAYSNTYGTCIQSPSCVGGSYNPSTDRCETTPSYSCSDSSYTYNTSRNRCEKAPVCSQGSYNPTYNKCLVNFTYQCPSGYAYNSTTSRCEMTPQCPAGYAWNAATNSCSESYAATPVYSCPSGGTLSGTTCTVNGSYPATVTYSCPSGGHLNGSTCYTKCTALQSGYGACLAFPPGSCAYAFFAATFDGSCNMTSASMKGQAETMCPDGSYVLSPGECNVGGTVCNNSTGNTCTARQSGYGLCSAAPSGSCAYGFFAATFDGSCKITSASYRSQSASLCPAGSYTLPPGACNDGGSGGSVCNNSTGTAATATYSCPSGGTLSGTTCTTTSTYPATVTYTCPSGGTLSGTTCILTASPACPSGSLDYTAHVCFAAYTPQCPNGMTYDSASNMCAMAPVCTNGLLDTTADVCYQAATTGCPSGYTLNSNVCTMTASCGPGGALNGSIDYCTATPTYTCPGGYIYSGAFGQCYATANCGTGSLNASMNICQQAFTSTCPAGYIQNSAVCQQNPSCQTGGAFNGSIALCDGGANVCASPLSLDTANALCFQAASCAGGTLNTTIDKCASTATPNCGTWSWDSAAGACFSSPVCSPGSYVSTDKLCEAANGNNCGSYTWNATDNICTQPIICPADPSFSLNATIAYSPTLDECVSDAQHTCPAGTTFNGLPVKKCEAVPVCAGDGIYDTTVHGCSLGMNSCPLGTQYTCMSNQGTMQCSPNQCFTAGSSDTEEKTPMDESMLQNDGQRDKDGNCLDQLFVFNGKASRCRPPGLTVGYINNCCDSDKIGSDDMGSNISTVASGIQTAYEIGQVAYYTNLVTSGAATLTPLVGTTSVGIVTATGCTTVSGAVASGVSAAAASGTTGAAAMGTAMEAYVGALFNPATIVVAVVVMVVMKILFGSGCDQGDIQTGTQSAAKDCHYVGDYCEKKWPLVGCVQKAKGYCCFNTKLARIIHEQGRPQLQSFGANGGWGFPNAPNCRGFTPDEFQNLDFSRIDLSEYFGDIQKDLSTKIQGAQTTIQNNVQQKFQATTGAQ